MTLEVRGLTVQFPGVRALDDVSVAFLPGSIHGVVGENGAGKSTLMRVMAGLQQPTSGSVAADDKPVVLHSADEARLLGVAMVHQELNLIETLTVYENLFLGREEQSGFALDTKKMRAAAKEFLLKLGSAISPEALVGSLSVGQMQIVEIAKALMHQSQVIILDEPTASLSENESKVLFEVLRQLRNEGHTIVYVSHRLEEVCSLCDEVTVLRDGKVTSHQSKDELSPSSLAKAMVGREISEMFPPKLPVAHDKGEALSLTNVSSGLIRNVSLTVRPGEIVGLAGLMGCGRTELAEVMVGLRRLESGSINVEGAPVRIKNPESAADFGITMLSEDRKQTGLLLERNIIENTTLANLDAYANPLLNTSAETNAAQRWRDSLGIKVNDLRASVQNLSGGNQQKVCLAKWLDCSPKVLILDEPTRGVDIAAKQEIYQRIHSLARDGLACLLISSEMAELIGLAHRIVVLRDGAIAGELSGNCTEQEIMHLAAGVSAA